MNKEEIKELINDPIIKVKVTESTNILMDLYELGFNNGFKLSQSQLDIANKKLDKIEKYIKENLIYIDDCDDQETILSIIGGE